MEEHAENCYSCLILAVEVYFQCCVHLLPDLNSTLER